MKTTRTTLSILLMLLIPGLSYAAGFTEISVSPPSPIADGEPIIVTASVFTDGSPGYLYAPTEISVTGTSIEIVLNVTSDCAITNGICLAVVLDFEESVGLGVLSPGIYDLDVEMLFTSASLLSGFPTTTSLGQRSASFTVVPEPTSTFLLGAGLALLTRHRREAKPVTPRN